LCWLTVEQQFIPALAIASSVSSHIGKILDRKMNKKLIYKYLPFSVNSLKLLIKGELWFGIPSNLNDPYEGEFTIKPYNSLPRKTLIEFFYEEHIELLNGISIEEKLKEVEENNQLFHDDLHRELRKRLKKCYGVTSFSYLNDDILMWSHYSDSHKGFCIEFDKRILHNTLKFPKDWLSFHDIDYKPYLVEAELIIERDKIGYKNERDILLRKLNVWKREHEMRIFTIFHETSKNRNIRFDKKSIKGIILGERMSGDDKKTLKEIINNDSAFSNVSFYSASKDFNKLKMQLEKE
jgi:hypothetical protein